MFLVVKSRSVYMIKITVQNFIIKEKNEHILAHCLPYVSYPYRQKENKYFKAQNLTKKMYYSCSYLWQHPRSFKKKRIQGAIFLNTKTMK